MKLSIIIVNYNVRHFLENCLNSVIPAIHSLQAEVMVVDNASTDDSPEMMRSKFPQVEYIYLNENLGFSKGNNMAIKKAKGEYILLLNPDTVVQEDTFTKCVQYMDSNPKVGGLGVHMIDGEGKFLPESKRGLPTPAVAFYKVFGLSSLFPKSKRFAGYHLGYLDEYECHKVDVLSGAFMMMRKSVLDQVGMLDEEYFMYGEDIDLSYRIIKGGYENHYFPETTIIHYKGESTKKGSLNYVFVFYRAMMIFARKHFERSQASLFSLMINSAIYFRASLALIRRVAGKMWQFIVDFIVIYLSFALATSFYEDFGHKDFSPEFISLLLPIYSFILTSVLNLSGAHDSPFKPNRLLRGWFFGLLMLLAVYALLPEGYRFSRAVLLIGALMALSTGFIWRMIAMILPKSGFQTGDQVAKRRLVIGNEQSLEMVKGIIQDSGLSNEFIAGVSLSESIPNGFVASYQQLDRAIHEFKAEEIIIDPSVSGYTKTISVIESSLITGVQSKILNGAWFIGPNNIIQAHYYRAGNNLNRINMEAVRRNKRIFDVVFAIISLTLSPFLVFIVDQKAGLFKNAFSILTGRKSWIGYDPRGLDRSLPKLKSGPIKPTMDTIIPDSLAEQAFESNVRYLQSSTFITDFQLALRYAHHLGD
ncbi:MAG: glycosyltransferase [Flavobacteriales bacterium]